ncbi:hypothetical protein CYMTET_35111 [Cymbomonas tetramitiformis]|uniref:Uncharacterized protein n=1 Tax=Cymbomonas tetramitiformis TaxID=36881 RepID=A0AAE0F9X8_9CHLO|nr:hypothetical protein CYMTET_35111 [Cymbomonas tetramitiformis]
MPEGESLLCSSSVCAKEAMFRGGALRRVHTSGAGCGVASRGRNLRSELQSGAGVILALGQLGDGGRGRHSGRRIPDHAAAQPHPKQHRREGVYAQRNGSQVSADGCQFSSNVALVAGAMGADHRALLEVLGSNFTNNTVRGPSPLPALPSSESSLSAPTGETLSFPGLRRLHPLERRGMTPAPLGAALDDARAPWSGAG